MGGQNLERFQNNNANAASGSIGVGRTGTTTLYLGLALRKQIETEKSWGINATEELAAAYPELKKCLDLANEWAKNKPDQVTQAQETAVAVLEHLGVADQISSPNAFEIIFNRLSSKA